MPGRAFHRWTAAEDRVVRRCALMLARGERASAEDVLPECLKALAALRSEGRKSGRLYSVRTVSALRSRVIKLARAAGRPRRRVRLALEERRLFDRYARLLVEGRFRRVSDAARSCLAAHERLRKKAGDSGIPARILSAVYQHVETRARRLGRPPGVAEWTPAENRVIERFARAVAHGRYRNVGAALTECRRELARLREPLRHTPKAVAARMRERAHALGWSAVFKVWSPDENTVADGFAEAVMRGGYPRATAATEDCLKALGEAGFRRRRGEVRSKLIRRTRELGRELVLEHWKAGELAVLDRYAQALADGRYPSAEGAVARCRRALVRAGFAERPWHGVRHKLLRRAQAKGRPRREWFWTVGELRRLERVARDYAAGKFPNIATAADAGLRALGRFRARGPRSSSGTQRVILTLARRYGRRPSWRLWSEAETRACDSWIRWYEKHRHVRRYRPASEAVRGLHDELLGMGGERTHGACRVCFFKRRLKLHGLG